jgi:adenosylcobinamide-phosphate synthase
MPLDASWVLPAVLVAALADALLGEPAWLYRRLPHPVVAIGGGIAWLESRLLDPVAPEARKRLLGALLLAVVAGMAAVVGAAIHLALRALPLGWLAEGALMGTLLAQRSLVQHVAAVADGLDRGLAEGRRAVALIVGRDPERLDEAGVGRAAVESLAENLSDGVVAPLFWGVVAGLPGMLAYKAVNTLDSMVGHKSERHRAFGWASARFDDLVNLIPARLTGALLCVAGAPERASLESCRVMLRDAKHHRSPNAGWPEAAMAAALGLRLAGPRVYGGVAVADAWMGDGRAEVAPADIRRGLRLAWRAWWLAVAVLAAAWVLALIG